MAFCVSIRYWKALQAIAIEKSDLILLKQEKNHEYAKLRIEADHSKSGSQTDTSDITLKIYRIAAEMSVHRFVHIIQESRLIRRLVFSYDMLKYESVVVKSISKLESQYRKNIEQILDDLKIPEPIFAFWTSEVLKNNPKSLETINSLYYRWLDVLSLKGDDLSVDDVCSILNTTSDNTYPKTVYQPKNKMYRNMIKDAVYADIVYKDHKIEIEVVQRSAKILKQKNNLLLQGMPAIYVQSADNDHYSSNIDINLVFDCSSN